MEMILVLLSPFAEILSRGVRCKECRDCSIPRGKCCFKTRKAFFFWMEPGVVCPESGLVVKTGALDEIIRVWREKFGL